MDHTDLLLRVTRLERSNKRLRLLALLPTAVVGLMALLAMQDKQDPKSGDVLHAKGIEVETLLAKRILVEALSIEDRSIVEDDRQHVVIADGTVMLFRGRMRGSSPMMTIDSAGVTTEFSERLTKTSLRWDGLAVTTAGPGGLSCAALVQANQEGAHVALLGPAAPGTADPAANSEDHLSPEELAKFRATTPLLQKRAELKFTRDGASLSILDSMNRDRVRLGVQATTVGGQSRILPESTLSLWDESGACRAMVPPTK